MTLGEWESFELFLQLFCGNNFLNSVHKFRESIQATVRVVLHSGITEGGVIYFFFLKICFAPNIL